MTDKIKNSLKERYKLANFFDKDGQRKIDHYKVLEKSEECTKQILEAQKNYIPKNLQILILLQNRTGLY